MTNTAQEVRTPANRVRNWTGTVHYASNGRPSCGTKVYGYQVESVATVTCSKCIALYGEDTPGQVDPEPTYYADEHAMRRAQERAARRANRV